LARCGMSAALENERQVTGRLVPVVCLLPSAPVLGTAASDMNVALMSLAGVLHNWRSRGPGGSTGRNAMELHFHRARTHWNRGFTTSCRGAPGATHAS